MALPAPGRVPQMPPLSSGGPFGSTTGSLSCGGGAVSQGSAEPVSSA